MTEKIIYQQLISNLETAIVLIDKTLRLQFINPAAEAMLEISGQRSIGESIQSIFRDNGELLTRLTKAYEHQGSFNMREVELILHTGNTIIVDYAVTTLTDGSGQLIEFYTRERLRRISRDEERIAQQATTQELVRGMAHEIKNPLGGIRGAAQLLARELPGNDLDEYTNIIIGEVDRLRNLVDRMLGPNNLPNLLPINIHEALERVYSLVKAENGDGITFKRDYDPSIPNISADAEQLIQACLNIVRNAMQAINEQPKPHKAGVITLRTRVVRQFTIGNIRYRHVLQIDIEDNGPGIPGELKDNLFYPMISGRAEGTGLGLSIAQTAINQHHGIIKLNRRSGHTIFSLFIPLDSQHEHTA